MNVSYQQTLLNTDSPASAGESFFVGSESRQKKHYISLQLVNEFVNSHGGCGVGMFRVYAGIKYFRAFSGNLKIKDRGHVSLLAKTINMPYRMIKMNIKRLIASDLMKQDTQGHWHTSSNDDIALESCMASRRISLQKEFLFSNRAASKYLRAAIVGGIENLYHVQRQITPNKFFIPRQMRDKKTPQEMHYLANGEAMVASSWTTRVVKKGYGVRYYKPLSGEYLKKVGINKSDVTIKGWRKDWPSSLGRWTPVQWVLNFPSREKRDECAAYIREISNIPPVTGVDEGVFWVALQMPSHYTSKLEVKRNRLSKETRKAISEHNSKLDRYGEGGAKKSAHKSHCEAVGISYANYKVCKGYLDECNVNNITPRDIDSDYQIFGAYAQVSNVY